ncbi:unnamed protein product [Kluyveromyces dobzhanskii CBS 2104]|nr:unnamed protein product [Kluyveromyces dobzhanskii CBS 2104]
MLNTSESKSEVIEESDDVDELPIIGSYRNSSARGSKNTDLNGPELPEWSDFFVMNETVGLLSRNFTFNTYFTTPQITDSKQPSIPIFLTHHGAGSSGLTYAPLAKTLKEELGTNFGIFSFDARGHGQTKPLDPANVTYYLDDFVTDFVELIVWLYENYLKAFDQSKISLILVGHSLGGSVCANTYERLPEYIKKHTIGLTMLDIVEEVAKLVLTTMDRFLSVTPNVFSTVKEAIDWYQSHNYSKLKQSAEISVPSLFTKTKSGKIVRITNLKSFQPFWDTWLDGLSAKFVSVPISKLLILAGNDNLDKELIVGQMQGKYQLIVFQDSGHFVQEDVPKKIAISLVDFWRRSDNKTVSIKTNWGSNIKP